MSSSIPNSASSTVRGWLHVQNGGWSGQGQVELVSDVNANQWFVLIAERIPGKSYRWYVNGKLRCSLRDLRRNLKRPT